MGGFAEFPVRVLEVINGGIPLPTPTVQNVMAFGAKGNGVANDAPGINAAIAAAGTGGVVYFPAGIYKVSTSIVISEPITLQGVGGTSNTSIGQLPPTQIIGSGFAVLSIQSSGVTVQDLMVRDNLGNAATVALQIGAAGDTNALVAVTVSRCSLVAQSGATKFYQGTGIRMFFAISCTFIATTIENWNHGVSYGSGSPVGDAESNSSPFIACRIRENVIGLYIEPNAAPDVMTTNCVIEANAVGLWYDHSTSASGPFIKDQGSHWENNNPHVTVPTATTIGTTTINLASSCSGFYGVASFAVPTATQTPTNGTDVVLASGTVVGNVSAAQIGGPCEWNGAGNLNFFGCFTFPPSFTGTGSVFAIAGNQALALSNPQQWEFNGVNLVNVDGAQLTHVGASIGLGGGAAPTLGTIGGIGPTTSAQNKWLQYSDELGNPCWLPVWQ